MMNWWRKIILAGAVLGTVGLMAACGKQEAGTGASSAAGKLHIGIVQPIEHGSLDESNRGFVKALRDQGLDNSHIVIDQQNAQGDPSNLKNIVTQMVSQKVDLILAIGTPPAQLAANETKDIPIVGTAIYDYKKANLVESLEHPGHNVTGTTNANPIPPQLDLYRRVVPGASRVGLLYSSTEVNSQVQAEAVREYCRQNHLTLVEATAPSVNDIPQAVKNMVGKVDFLYLPTDNIMAAAIPTITGVTDPAGIPVFAGADEMVKAGVLGSLSVNYYEIGYEAGLMAVKILRHEAVPADMPITGLKKMKTVFNKEAMKKLHVSLPPELQQEAEII